MLVLLIMGLGVSLVALSVGGSDVSRRLYKAAEQFSALAKLATDQATLGSEPIGLVLVPAELDRPWEYYWQRYRDEQWQDEAEPLQRRQLDLDILLELEVQGEPVDLTQVAENKGPPLPAIVFYPSGEATPFLLTFASDALPDEPQQVRGGIGGQIQWPAEQWHETY